MDDDETGYPHDSGNPYLFGVQFHPVNSNEPSIQDITIKKGPVSILLYHSYGGYGGYTIVMSSTILKYCSNIINTIMDITLV